MYRIGIDLGGTNIAVGVVNERHEIVSHTSVPTLAHRSPEAVIADMGHAVQAALDQAGITAADCASIGVGSPGTCDSDRGVVVRAYNLGWYEVPVCQMLTERFGIPARLSNDANCAALAEYVAGAGAGCRNMVLITLGTGVGGGIIIDGKIYAGMRSAGAELGHTVLVLDGEPCTCGRRGCWEAYASATALIRQTGQAALAHPESLLASIPAQDINGRTAFDAAEQGDATARAVVARYCEYVAAGLTDLVNALAPERILLGGGISRQGESLLGPVREYVAAHCFGQRQGAIPVIAEAKLGNEAGIIGAAAL
ncbi:MAG: ROK family glucokinase [Oscillospiraceae bacterium]|nr:ROK family glucokinase [Oscillospiraceae bacterium]